MDNGWRNNNIRKQILKAFFPRSIRKILIMNHVNVVFGKKLIYHAAFRFHSDTTSQSRNKLCHPIGL